MKHQILALFGLLLLISCAITGCSPAPSPESTTSDSSETTSAPAQVDDSQPASAEQPVDTAQESVSPNADVNVGGETTVLKVADEKIHFDITTSWETAPKKSNMLDAELKIPGTGDQDSNGRLTIMGAGGSIEDNISRWETQFKQGDGNPTEAKEEDKKINNQLVTIVDISGIYLDSPGGPFAGGKIIERENYRMLAAIIETEMHGNYFVKFTGPQATVDANEAKFRAMIDSVKIVD